MTPPLTHSWRRYWVERGQIPPGDGLGFLLDPGDDPLRLEASSLKMTAQLDSGYPCLVLLGEAGLGKTFELQTHLRRAGDLFLNLGEVSDAWTLNHRLFDTAEFRNWLQGNGELTVLLDSMDESPLALKELSGMLRHHLERAPRERLRLRVACRPHVWPEDLDRTLGDWWGPGYGRFEILPLTRRDVAGSAQAAGLDPDTFLEAVVSRDLVSLAARPVTLEFLLRQARDQEMPGSIHEVYSRGLERLVSWDPASGRTQGDLKPAEVLALARRVAAMTLLCGRPLVSVRPPTYEEPAVLSVLEGDISSGVEPAGGDSLPVNARNLKEVLGTGLFTAVGNHLGWSHRTFAEFLSAEYLRVHQFSDAQVRSLLFHRDDRTGSEGTIPTQLHGVATWLARDSRDLVQRIVRTAPEILVNSTLGEQPEEVRAEVVEGVLRGMEEGRLSSWDRRMRVDYRWMDHPRLGEQLRVWFLDRSRGDRSRQVALEIARACRCSSVAPRLAEIALDGGESMPVRSTAAWALASLEDLPSRLRLRPLVDGDSEDHDDDLKGAALQALWPELLSSEDLFAVLRPPRQDRLFGLYANFLSTLPEALGSEHLGAALEWVRRQEEGHRLPYWLQKLVDGILDLAWESLECPGVLEAFVGTALNRLSRYEPVVASPVRERPEFRSRARLVLSALVPRLSGARPGEALALMDLVAREDFDWLVDQALLTAELDLRLAWQQLASLALRYGELPNLNSLSRGMQLQDELPELYQYVGPWVEAIPLDSEKAAELRTAHRRQLERSAAEAERAERSRAAILSRLEEAESGNLAGWWLLNLEFATSLRDTLDEHEPDLTALETWRTLSPNLEQRCLDVAQIYLAQADPATSTWLGKSVLNRPAAAGARALVVLYRLRPDALACLDDGTWARWTPILLAFPGPFGCKGEEALRALLPLAWDRAPQTFSETLGLVLEREKRGETGHLFILERLTLALSSRPDLQDYLLRMAASDSSLLPTSFQDLIEPPMEHGNDRAFDLARSAFVGEGEWSRPVRAMAGSLLLRHRPRAYWEDIWRVLRGDPQFGKEVLLCLGNRWDIREPLPLTLELEEHRLADLYELLCELFPPAPHEDLASGVVLPEHHIAELRNGIPGHLSRRGTSEAVEALTRLFEGIPNQRWLAYQVAAAEAVRVERAYEPPTPQALVRMARARAVRLVRTADELMELVLETLEELQEELRRSRFLRESLWNPDHPKEEAQLRDLVWKQLDDRLVRRGVVANREVLVDPSSETDIFVTAVRPGEKPGPYHLVRVIVEVKGDWNDKVTTAMRDQLLEQYMIEANCSHGIYLVGWFGARGGATRRQRVQRRTLEQFREFLEGQARNLSGARHLRAVILDTSRPVRTPAKKARMGAVNTDPSKAGPSKRKRTS